ncbi:Os01g0298200 [Oryza sativa Japonica Group]|uniref:Os01g0298200 protein n=1 Tax=Oryza sativa subsp. japonica TaxID=39947 RepID=A0A0P0V1W4_ORYSJ|nr:Os01g0298200 [Oryza sativa Japonica Group]
MDDYPKFMQIELRSGLVLLLLTYTPSRVARDGGKKKRGKAAGAGTSRPRSAPAPVKAESVGSSIYPGVNAVEGAADAAQGGLGFPEVPPGFEKVKATPAPATPAPVASPSTASAKKQVLNSLQITA